MQQREQTSNQTAILPVPVVSILYSRLSVSQFHQTVRSSLYSSSPRLHRPDLHKWKMGTVHALASVSPLSQPLTWGTRHKTRLNTLQLEGRGRSCGISGQRQRPLLLKTTFYSLEGVLGKTSLDQMLGQHTNAMTISGISCGKGVLNSEGRA